MADTSLIYPYEFEGGKKAVASEVNANFEAVKSFANGINVSLNDLRTAIDDLKNKPTREMFDIYYSFSGVTPAGAYPLWTGETITHCKSLYPQFWNKLKNLSDLGNLVTVDTPEAYEERLAQSGQCAAFYIDELNGHVRLPKITRFISSIAELSQLAMEETSGLPNITGSGYWNFLNPVTSGADSAVYGDTSGTSHLNHTNGSSHSNASRFLFDASRSNAIYGASDEVQPPAIRLCLYLQVANNIGELSELDTQAIANELEEALTTLNTEFTTYYGELTSLYERIKDDILDSSPVIKETDVAVLPEMFVADTTYTDYPYRVEIPLGSAEERLIPTVNFALPEAESGNYASVAESVSGMIKIYAKEVAETAFIIPSIILQ